MRNSVLKLFTIIFVSMITFSNFAAGLVDPNIEPPTNVTLNDSGTAKWSVFEIYDSYGYPTKYKSFQVRLLKREDSMSSGTIVYNYKEVGSVKNVKSDEYSCDFTFSTVGYYQVKVRAVNLSGNYSEWVQSGVDISINDSSPAYTGGVHTSTNPGPGTYDPYYYPYYNYNPYTPYNYNPNYPNYNPYSYIPNYNQNQQNEYGPGTTTTTTTREIGPGLTTTTTTTTTNGGYAVTTPGGNRNFNASVRVGWNQDARGWFYLLEDGTYFNNTWALISDKYYRFDESGYMLKDTFYRDATNNSYYLLGSDGSMLTGWQLVNGRWYYLNPNRGQGGYGIMYANVELTIDGKTYSFDENGVMLTNSYKNGFYYGSDGSRQAR